MKQRSEQIIEHNKLHFAQLTDLFQAIMGSHIHWGYFEDRTLSLAAAQDALVDKLLSFASLNSQTLLLDVGCGIGGTVISVHRKYGCRAFGITNNEKGVQLASDQARSQKLEHSVEFIQADALDNGLASDFFDVVIMIEVAYMIPDKERLLRENYRVLKPGGTLLLCDNMTERNLTAGEMFKYYSEINSLKQIFGEGKYESLETYRNLATKAGFKEKRTYDISQDVLPTTDNVLAAAQAKRPELLKHFSAESINQFETCWKFTKELCEKGISTYGIVHAIK